MSKKHLIDDQPFTCCNARFCTDLSQGKPHGIGNANGSVFPKPLVDDGNLSLWLEYVIDQIEPHRKVFWLMWYDKNGTPKIPMSAVLEDSDIQDMSKQLAAFIRVP